MALYARWCDAHHGSFLQATAPDFLRFHADNLSRVSRQTAMNRVLAARSYYRYLVTAGLRPLDPTAQIAIKRDKLLPRRPFSDTEIADLYAGCLRQRDRAIIAFLLGSGCRRDELARLRIEDIDWRRQRVLVRGKGAKERFVSPGPTALVAIRELIMRRKTGPVFDITGHALYLMMRRVAARGGVVNAYPHKLRITFAVRFLRRYHDIAALRQLMGHENITTTEHYASYGIVDAALAMQAELDLGAAG